MENLDQIKSDISEIKTALIGNPEFGQEGLIDQVKKNSKARRKMYKAGGFFTGLVIAWESIKAYFES